MSLPKRSGEELVPKAKKLKNSKNEKHSIVEVRSYCKESSINCVKEESKVTEKGDGAKGSKDKGKEKVSKVSVEAKDNRVKQGMHRGSQRNKTEKRYSARDTWVVSNTKFCE